MTIHSTHPFADPEPDPARRFRGRLGGAVSLWTAGLDGRRAGLTVSSLLLAQGEPARMIGLLDPDSDLVEVLLDTGRAMVHLLSWHHRDLAEVFAGAAPAPGGPFRAATFADSPYGPVLADATTRASVALESSIEVGWSLQVTCVVDDLVIGEDDSPLHHLRGRYHR